MWGWGLEGGEEGSQGIDVVGVGKLEGAGKESGFFLFSSCQCLLPLLCLCKKD